MYCSYQWSTLGPNHWPTHPVSAIPSEYQIATKAIEVSGHANEYPIAPSTPATNPAAKPACFSRVGARLRIAQRIAVSAGNESIISIQGQIHHVCPNNADHRSPSGVVIKFTDPASNMTRKIVVTAVKAVTVEDTGRDSLAARTLAPTSSSTA